MMTVTSLKASYMSLSDFELDEIEDEYEEEEITREEALESLVAFTEIYKDWLQDDPKGMRFCYNNRRNPDEIAWSLLSTEEQEKLYH